MDDRGANIDILFRNGLKNLEVLPPSEVWNNISPVIVRKPRPSGILRAAALVAVLLSLSFLAYRYSRNFTTEINNSLLSDNTGNPVNISNNDEVSNSIPQGSVRSSANSLLKEENDDIFKASVNQAEKNEGITSAPFDENNDISINSEVNEADLIRLVYEETPVENYPVALPVIELYNPLVNIDNPPVNDNERWTIGALVSPTYNRSFHPGNNDFARELISSENQIVTYTGGVSLSYKINKRISIQSGLYYSSVAQELSGITSFSGFQSYDRTKGDYNFEVYTANGTVLTKNADVFLVDKVLENRIVTQYTVDVFDPAKANLQVLDESLKQSFSYLELPFILRYKVVDKTVDFNLIGGLSYNLLVNNDVYATIDGNRYMVGETGGMNLMTFSSSLGMGMEYNITGKFTLNLEPTFRYYINPFNEASGISIHPYSFGIFSGLSYRF